MGTENISDYQFNKFTHYKVNVNNIKTTDIANST